MNYVATRSSFGSTEYSTHNHVTGNHVNHNSGSMTQRMADRYGKGKESVHRASETHETNGVGLFFAP